MTLRSYYNFTTAPKLPFYFAIQVSCKNYSFILRHTWGYVMVFSVDHVNSSIQLKRKWCQSHLTFTQFSPPFASPPKHKWKDKNFSIYDYRHKMTGYKLQKINSEKRNLLLS